MKTGFVFVLFLGVSVNAFASVVDGRWYFTESRCLNPAGEVQRKEQLNKGEAMWFDFAGAGGSGVIMVRNAQGLCTIDFSMRVSGNAMPSSRIFVERQVKVDAPRGCADHMTANQSAFEFAVKQEAAVLELRETRPNSEACRTRISYLNRDPAGTR